MGGAGKEKPKFDNANFPLSDGRTYHVCTKKGEVANRIITVGDSHRLNRIKAHLSDISFESTSKRNFSTVTGKYKGVPVSIVAIGMGYPVMDMFVREIRHTIDGAVYCIRLGSCGSVSEARIGQVAVADSCVAITRNHNAFNNLPGLVDGEEPYFLSNPCPADPELTQLLTSSLRARLSNEKVVVGMNAQGDTFYASQGRQDDVFIDHNDHLLATLKKKYPQLKTLEMETFTLFQTAKCSRIPFYAAGCHMIFAERLTNDFIDPSTVEALENMAGLAVLDALVAIEDRN